VLFCIKPLVKRSTYLLRGMVPALHLPLETSSMWNAKTKMVIIKSLSRMMAHCGVT